MKIAKKTAGTEGAAAVEFALVLPMLLLLVFGTIEFSVLLYDKAMITNAGREGARLGIVYQFDPDSINHPDDGEIIARVNQYAADHLISLGADSTVETAITRTGDAPGDALTVTLTYHYDFLIFSALASLVGGSIADLMNLNAVTVMRLE